ncbi:MAG: hypothetical protein NTV51_10540 [Verrucomicrobia bacterium]|nr:hypothetical protein [Verrucomicrobiota bacterium]
MKSPLKFLAAFFAACFITVAAMAADASPAGTWKWMQPGRGGGPGTERSLILELKDGKLTGKLAAWQMGDNTVPETAIGDASFKAGVVAFTVTMEFNGNKRVSKYEGKLEGDKITGSIEAPGRDGQTAKRDWAATRSK